MVLGYLISQMFLKANYFAADKVESLNCIVFIEVEMCTISQRSLENNELVYFINFFFLKNHNVNLLMCLHLETNSSCMLSSDSGSAFMIAISSVKHRSHFLAPPVYGGFTNNRPLKVIIYAAIFQLGYILTVLYFFI